MGLALHGSETDVMISAAFCLAHVGHKMSYLRFTPSHLQTSLLGIASDTPWLPHVTLGVESYSISRSKLRRLSHPSNRHLRLPPAVASLPMQLDALSSAQQLLKRLRNGRHLTQGEAADELGVSPRQVRRLIKQLRANDIPVQEERSGRKKEYFLPPDELQVESLPVALSERQVLALVVAAEAARSALRPTPLSEPLRAALEELIGRISPHVHTFEPDQERAHWHFGDAPSAELDPDVFETLAQAIDEQQTVQVDYFTASTGRRWTGRRIDPLVMAAPGGSWICVAYCHIRDGLRDFSLAGIKSIEPSTSNGTPDYFDRPEEFDPDMYFRDRFGALAGDEIYEVRLLVEPDRAPYFERKEYHPTQVVEEVPEDRTDDRMVVSYEVAGLKDVRAWVRSWGPGVKVLAPPELASMVAEDAAATRAQYE